MLFSNYNENNYFIFFISKIKKKNYIIKLKYENYKQVNYKYIFSFLNKKKKRLTTYCDLKQKERQNTQLLRKNEANLF